ncbi:ribonuclease H-like domain-containing protein [Tanacetum coccineum]
MDALLKNDIWDIVDLPKDRKAIRSKWIFKIKYTSGSEIDRYKARLVTQGFGQKEGIDYEDTFSLIVKMVIDTDKGFCLNQRKYVLDLLSEYGMLACKPAKTPLMSKHVISNEATDDDPIFDNITDYQKLMGKLIDLTNNRRDISYDVHFLKDLNFDNFLPVSLYCDSNSAIKIAANPVFHERTKYLEIDLHFVREEILDGVVKTVKVDSANQIADILTKGFDTLQHKVLVEKLGMFDIYQVQVMFVDCWIVGGALLLSVDSHMLGQGL